MKGFSLTELLISVSILVILIFASFAAMNTGRSAWLTADESVQLRQEIIKIFMRMEKELKETRPAQTSLTIGSSSPSLTFKMPQDNNGDGTVLDAFANVEWSGDITYARNGNNQITRTASGSTDVLANNVVSLLFTRPTSPTNILQIDITVRKTTVTGRQLQDIGQIMIKMRN